MKKINLFFDLFGVITNDGLFATNVFYPLVKERISYDLFKKKYLLYCLGIINDEDFWEGIEIRNDRNLILENILDKTFLNKDVCALILELKDEYNLYIASEAPRIWAKKIISRTGIGNCFKEEFYSSDLKITKPFSGFYKKIISLVGENKQNIFIDDTLANIDKIKSVGASAIYFNQDIEKNNSYEVARTSWELRKILCNL